MFEESKHSLSKLIRINSTDALPGSASKSDFFVDLGLTDATEKSHAVSVKSVLFCNCFYNINARNQDFVFRDNLVDHTVTIPEGQYTIADYIIALKSGIDAKLTAGSVTITQSAVDDKLTFAFVGLIIDVELYTKTLNPAANFVGITSNLIAEVGNAFTVKLQSTPRAYGLVEAFIQINEVAQTGMIDPATAIRNILTNVPISAPYGGINVYEPTNSEITLLRYPTKRSYRIVHIQLVDRDGNVLDLQNHNMRMVLKSYYETQ